MNKTVCTVLVTYNRIEVLKNTLSHVFAQFRQSDYLVIVDNNSTDGTGLFLSTLQNNRIHCLCVDRNVGYAGGIAHGFEHALKQWKFDYFWIMDDDSLPAPNTLEVLLDRIQGSGFDMVGSIGFKYRYGKKREIVSSENLLEADYVLIDGALVRSTVVAKIGAPSDKYFMMCEDYEYCKRMKRHGFKVGVLTLENINRLHLGGAGKFTYNTLWRGYYHSRNHMLILKQYFSVQSLLNYIIMQSKFIIAAAILAPDRIHRVRLRVAGIWDGLFGRDGKTLDPITMKFHYQKKVVPRKDKKIAEVKTPS